MSPGEHGTLLLVHGANHGAWCWLPVLERLAYRGLSATAVDLPFTSFQTDVAAVRAAITGLKRTGPVTVVAHSYAGAVVSAAAHHASNLVYIAATLPMPGESLLDTSTLWTTPALRAARKRDTKGNLRALPGIRRVLYSKSPANLADFAMQQLRPMRSRPPSEPLADPAWLHVPSTYIVCTQDRAVPPDAQRKRGILTRTCVELECDHSPFFSAPEQLTEVLAKGS